MARNKVTLRTPRGSAHSPGTIGSARVYELGVGLHDQRSRMVDWIDLKHIEDSELRSQISHACVDIIEDFINGDLPAGPIDWSFINADGEAGEPAANDQPESGQPHQSPVRRKTPPAQGD